MKKFIILLISLTYFIIFPIQAKESKNHIEHGPFNLSWCHNGQFYFERMTDLDYPINFVLVCGNNKRIIDRYYVEGADLIYSSKNEKQINMEVISTFFHKINEEKFLFVMIKRHGTHTGVGINADDYTIYPYKYDREHIIASAKDFADNNFFGVEGQLEWKEVHFKYKTADEVKKYLDKTYNNK